MLDSFFKLLKALNSDRNPWQIAFALCLGMVLGLTPFWSWHNLLVLLFACVLRVHFGSFMVGWVLFSALAFALDPWMISLGETLLLNPELAGFWTYWYQLGWPRLFHFHNTLTLGSLVLSLGLFLPLAWLLKVLIERYRVHALAYINRLKIMQMIKASKLFAMYQTLSHIRG